MWIEINDVATTANGGFPIDVSIKQLPAVEVKTIDLPGGEPGDASLRLQVFSIDVKLSIEPDTYNTASFVTAANAVIRQFYPDLNENAGYKKFRYSDEPSKCIYARVESGFKVPQAWPISERNQAEIDISLTTRTHYWLSNTATTGTIAAGAATGSVSNDGDLNTQYAMTATFTGAVTAFSITANSLAITVTGNYGTATTATIDTETKEIKVNGNYIAAGGFSGDFPNCPTGTQTITKTSANVALAYSITKRYRS